MAPSTSWWKPRSNQIDLPSDAQSSWRKMGRADKAALLLFEEIRALVLEDDWMDCIEAIVVATSDVDPDDIDKFEKAYDRIEKYVIVRACRALINNYEDRPDRIAHIAYERSTERAAQT